MGMKCLFNVWTGAESSLSIIHSQHIQTFYSVVIDFKILVFKFHQTHVLDLSVFTQLRLKSWSLC